MRTVKPHHALGSVIWRAGEQDRRLSSAFRHEDEGLQLHAIAHGDHFLALNVIEGISPGLENFWCIAWQVGRNRTGADIAGKKYVAGRGERHPQSDPAKDSRHSFVSARFFLALPWVRHLGRG